MNSRNVAACAALAAALIAPVFCGLCNPLGVISITDQHFLLNTYRTNMLSRIIFHDMTGQVVEHSFVPSNVMNRIADNAQRILIPMRADGIAITSRLCRVVDYPNAIISLTSDPSNQSFSVTLPNATPLSAWIQALPNQTNIVSCNTTSDVAYLEYVDRLAQFLELQVGVLTNGELIFGTAGNWPTNFMPQYTIELDVRYGR